MQTFFEETQGQGSVFEDLTPGQDAFLDFPGGPAQKFINKVTPPGTPSRCLYNCRLLVLMQKANLDLLPKLMQDLFLNSGSKQ